MAHWYVVGASAERLAEIRAADHLVDDFGGPLDRDEQSSLYRRIANAAPDGLWITWTALEPPNIDALRRLRVAQPGLAIILEISSDMAPPNPDLAQVVGLGIYGIAPESASFASVTARIYTYADAAAWQRQVRSFDEPDPEPREKIVEKIVEREVVREVVKKVATTSRPALVSCWGQQPGSGTTTLAMSIASYLSGLAPTVVLDHAPATNLNGHPEPGQTGLYALSGVLDPTKFPDLTVLPSIVRDDTPIIPDVRSTLKSHDYAYVVCDGGPGPPADETGIGVWRESDLIVLCIPPAFTRWQGVWPLIARQAQTSLGYAAVVFGDQSPCPPDDPDFACVSIPWPDQPGHSEALAKLLARILPDDATVIRQRRARTWAIRRWIPWPHTGKE